MRKQVVEFLAGAAVFLYAALAAQNASAALIDVKSTSKSSTELWTITSSTLDSSLWTGGSYSDSTFSSRLYTQTTTGQDLFSSILSLTGSQTGSSYRDWLTKLIESLNSGGVRTVSVSEPSTLSLLGLGLVGVALSIRRRRRAAYKYNPQ